MAFPIDTNIPAAANNPSVDQPGMQTNYANISGFLGVDHTAPGSSPGAGQHNQVTFNLNQSAPSITNGVAGEYVNLFAGMFGNLSTLFFQNGTQNLNLTNIGLTFNFTFVNAVGTNYGFVSPWGLIFNFGVMQIITSPANITFAVPMLNAQYAALVQIQSASASGASATVTNFSSTNLNIFTTRTSNTTHYYLAIGS